ncbi:MAG: thermonuclease family protein [Thermodesulfobacteriota bacterium]
MSAIGSNASIVFKAATVVVLVLPVWAGAWSGTVTAVTEGDSLVVSNGNSPTTIRLHGVDCPEKGQDFFDEATRFACGLVLGKTVEVEPVSVDHHDRIVAKVSVEGMSLNEELVRTGLAWWYPYYAPGDTRLAELHDKAKASKVGLWSRPEPTEPWEYRDQRRPPGAPRYILQELTLKPADLPERLRNDKRLARIMQDLTRDGKVVFRFSAPGPVARSVESGELQRVGSVVVVRTDEKIDSIMKVVRVVLVLGGATGEAFQTGNPWRILTTAANLVSYHGSDGQLAEIQKQLGEVQKQLKSIHGYVKALYDAPFRDAQSYLRSAANADDPAHRRDFMEKACNSFQKARNQSLALLKVKKSEILNTAGTFCEDASGEKRLSACTTVSDAFIEAKTIARTIDLCYRYEATLRERLSQFKVARGLRWEALEFKLDLINHLEDFVPGRTEGCFSKVVAYSDERAALTVNPMTWWGWLTDTSRSRLKKVLHKHEQSLHTQIEGMTHSVALDLFFLSDSAPLETRLAMY